MKKIRKCAKIKKKRKIYINNQLRNAWTPKWKTIKLKGSPPPLPSFYFEKASIHSYAICLLPNATKVTYFFSRCKLLYYHRLL